MMVAPYATRKLTSAGVFPTSRLSSRTRTRSTASPFRFVASTPVVGESNAWMTVTISSRVVPSSIACRRQMDTLRFATALASQCNSCTRSRFKPCEMSCSNPGRSVAETPRTMRPRWAGSFGFASGSVSTVTFGGPNALAAARLAAS